MAISDASLSDGLLAKLEVFLHRARQVKQSTTIDPPLQVTQLATDNQPLLGPISGNKDTYSSAFEKAAKNLFYDKIGQTPIEAPAFVDVWNLLDITQYFGDRNICSSQLVLLLIEDLLDSQSIAGCRIVFTFLESRREAIIAQTSKNKDLVILRLSNELLRRLSRAEDPVFCGRVYIFLFQSFPLSDKSSVNLRGNFHTENVTTFEDFLRASAPDGDPMDVETSLVEDVKEERGADETGDKPTQSEKPSKEAPSTLDIDTLYPVFWSLQESFSNPPKLFSEENFKQFQKSLEATLAKFKEVPKVIQSGDSERKNGDESPPGENHDEFASSFNPKYLTSRDLFKLELSDLAFQRHILVQALILIDFLLTLTEKGKTKPYYQNSQKAMQYPFTLREEDTEWALGIKNSIANYLQDGPDGKFYYRMVDTVLSRDKNWVRWKMENCQPFTRDRDDTKHFLDANSGAQAELSRKKVAAPWGNQSSLMFMLNTDAEKGLAKLKQADRFTAPSAESYATKVRMTELDLEMVTSDEERRQIEERQTSNTWRGLRLASKSRLKSFDRLEQGKGLERLFQPIEAAGEDNAPTNPEDRDSVPHEQDNHGAEERRAGQQSQVTMSDAAE